MRPFAVRVPSLALLSLALCGCPSGERAADAFELPYVKYELANGLDVILHEDHSDPIVAIATLVHVGSNREQRGRTGFAHFFEHMSFNDSENVPRGANRKLIGELGGTRNGGTWTDGTIYYEVVPTDALAKLMWIDSDRLGFMINTVTESALENEKQVVKNEKRQRVDNAPYGHTRDVVLSALYPPDHPYSWSVLGSLADLQSATLDDVRRFYDRYYGAANATLVIAGDIDPGTLRPLVERWFGEIRRGEPIERPRARKAELRETRSVYHLDNFAQVPELRMVFPSVESFHPDQYALDALARILADGKRAPLYKVLVEEGRLAPEVEASHTPGEIAGTFTIRVRAHAGVDLDRVQAGVETALARFAEQGFLDRDLERIKAESETEFFGEMESVLDKAFQLANYNEYAGDPGFAAEDLRRMRAVTREDVVAAFERYIAGRPCVVTSFVPRDGAELAVDGSQRAAVVEEAVVPGAEREVEAEPEVVGVRTPTRHERGEPPLGPPPVVAPPRPWSAELANGIAVLGIEQRELPLFELSVRLRGGHLLDPPGKTGAALLLAELLTEGTRRRTPEELEDAIGELGAEIEVTAGGESLTLSARGLARTFPAVAALVEEILLEPRWDGREFERLKSGQQNRVRERQGDPQSLAADAFDAIVYGDAHPRSIPTIGTLASVAAITLADLQAYYERSFSASLAAIHVAGDLGRDEVLAGLRGIERRFAARPVALPASSVPASPVAPVLYFIDVPGSKQSVIQVGKLALAGGDADYNDLVYANTALGAGSSARLFQLLRIAKGYTYGAGSSIPRTVEIAPLRVQTSVRANVTLESLQLIRDELRNYRGTFTERDLATTKNLLLKQATREFETLSDLISLLEEISDHDLPHDFVERDLQELEALTLEEVHATIERYMDESRMVYVVVGDGATQRERIAALGYGPPRAWPG